MSHFLPFFFLAVSLASCQQTRPAPIPAAGAAITGTVVERVDDAPYSYLRLATEQGEIWAAVPMESVAKGGKVTVKNGAPVKNFTAPGMYPFGEPRSTDDVRSGLLASASRRSGCASRRNRRRTRRSGRSGYGDWKRVD